MIFAIFALVVFLITMAMFWASRYRRCPSDRILVVFGSVGAGKASMCIHGGGKFVWPLIQRSEERRVGKECRSRWSPYH